MDNLLIVDDNISFLNDLEILLKKHFNITKANNGKQAEKKLADNNIDAILLDLNLPDIDGIKLLENFNNKDPDLPVIIITERNNVATAVTALKKGAVDYFPKVSNIDLLAIKIKKALDQVLLKSQVKILQETIDSSYNNFIYQSEIMKSIDFEITKFAKFDVPVLLLGETGVGKDLVAWQIHKRSLRSDFPFVSLPIKSLSNELIESELFGHEKGAFTGATEKRVGKLEGANNGTIYLPEISELNESIQLKLLEFLQYQTIERVGSSNKSKQKLNVRLIVASNEDIDEQKDCGKLREDFYYRIKVTTLYIPPLRERKEDIPVLAKYFIDKYSKNYYGKLIDVKESFFIKLKHYNWKGNIRQLENFIINCLISSNGKVISEDLIDKLYVEKDSLNILSTHKNIDDYKETEEKFRKHYFSMLFEKTNGNISKASEISGLSRQSLYKIKEEYHLE